METTKIDIGQEYSADMQEVFYAEELEDRFEMIIAAPNGVCWNLF